MDKRLVGLVAVIGALAAAATQAADVGIYGKVGSSGYGAGLGLKLSDQFRARVEYNAFSFDPGDDSSTNITTNSVDYSTQLDLRYGGLLVDWHPFSGVFRLTGGLIMNDSKLKMEAVDGYLFVGNTFYSAAALDAHATADFPSTAPYLGIGWGDVAGTKGHFSFVADVGLLFQGSPNVKLSANCAATGSNANACRQRLVSEERQLQDDADDFQYWPFLSVGVGYRF